MREGKLRFVCLSLELKFQIESINQEKKISKISNQTPERIHNFFFPFLFFPFSFSLLFLSLFFFFPFKEIIGSISHMYNLLEDVAQ